MLSYQRLRNLRGVGTGGRVAGRIAEAGGVTSRVTKVAKRFIGVPDFHYYALADGQRVLLPRLAVRCP
jgi:hypothetical protein